jgi:4,5-dihydroxyphthalate decarboxylase
VAPVQDVPLTLAMRPYPHVRDLLEHRVPVPGISLTHLDLPIPEINARFALAREWEVSEFGLGKYSALRSQGDDSITAIPVFPHRAFRQRAMFVRADSDLRDPRELEGRTVGIPEWAQTAAVYARGFLVEQYGVDLARIAWVQAGVNDPGRAEKVALCLPAGVRYEPRPDRSLNGMLQAGEVDAVISAEAPSGVGTGAFRTLLADPDAAEQQYFRATKVFPIMHLVAIRRDVIDAHPWVAKRLTDAFEAARRPFGDVPPYGLEPNRPTLEAFLRYAHEQGITERRMAPEELFTP